MRILLGATTGRIGTRAALLGAKAIRIGIIGMGFVGAALYRWVTDHGADDFDVAFVHNRSSQRLEGVDPDLILTDLDRAAERMPDLIVECAHPGITRRHGRSLLSVADYMPLSVTALAEQSLLDSLVEAAQASANRLLVPSGALVGTDSLFSWREMWRDVTITFRKHPRNLDFAQTRWTAEEIEAETVLYDGPVRGIAPLFPRNVNTMVTCALATVGLDRCRARLIADPALDVAVAEVEAWGQDGSYLATTRRQPAIGVSGTEMFQSTLRSIMKAGDRLQPLDFV